MLPEAECIGKGKASAPYEFGVKVSIVTTNARTPGGQFVLHSKALPAHAARRAKSKPSTAPNRVADQCG
jgi:hypothetical protein